MPFLQPYYPISPFVRYNIALVAGALASTLAIGAPPLETLKLPLILFYTVLVIACSWVGGFGPGVVATVLCSVAAAYWLEPHGAFAIGDPGDLFAIVLFLLIGAALGALGERVHRAMRFERSARELAEEVAAAERSLGRMREEVLAIVAHDLRDPLAVIELNAVMIGKAPGAASDAEISRRTAIVRRTVRRMNRLLRSLLDATAIETNALSLELAAESPERLIAEVIDSHIDAAEAKSVQLRHEVSERIPTVLCDRDRILQVLTNLVVNALKFTPTDGTITVQASVTGHFVRFSVADTGLGIDAAELPRIFERYFSASRHGGGGLGLGLFIANGIVKAHHGTIEVDSKVGEGSIFSFTVPIMGQACAGAPEAAARPVAT